MTCTHTYITYIKHTFMCVCMSCMYVHSYTGEVYVHMYLFIGHDSNYRSVYMKFIHILRVPSSQLLHDDGTRNKVH